MKIPSAISRLLTHRATSISRILVGGLVLRLLVWVLYGGMQGGEPPLAPLEGPTRNQAGIDGYLQMAETLLDHGQYAFQAGGPKAHHRAPAQAFLFVPQLALARALGVPWWVVWAGVSSLLGVAQVWLGIRLVRRWGGAQPVQRLAGLLLAFNPLLILAVRPTTPVLVGGLGVLLVAGGLHRLHEHRRSRFYTLLLTPLGGLLHPSLLILMGVSLLRLLAPWVEYCRNPKSGPGKSGWPPARLGLLGLLLLPGYLLVLAFLNFFPPRPAEPLGGYSGLGYQYWVGVNQQQGGYQAGETAYHLATGDSLQQHYYGAVHPQDADLLRQLAWQDIRRRPGAYLRRVGRATVYALAPPGPPASRPWAYGLGNAALLLLLAWGLAQGQVRRATAQAGWLVLLLLAAVLAPPLSLGLTGAYLLFGLPLLTAYTGWVVGKRLGSLPRPE